MPARTLGLPGQQVVMGRVQRLHDGLHSGTNLLWVRVSLGDYLHGQGVRCEQDDDLVAHVLRELLQAEVHTVGDGADERGMGWPATSSVKQRIVRLCHGFESYRSMTLHLKASCRPRRRSSRHK